MRGLYFDCSSGISGNMTLGALLEVVEDKTYLQKELDKLNVDGYHLEIENCKKLGISATHVEVVLDEHEHKHEHEHEHKHEHKHEHVQVQRHLKDVNAIIDDSSIAQEAKDLAKKIFLRVAKAESKVHNEPLDHVHFHEVGAIDSIVDIIGTSILITQIHPEFIMSSIVNDGHGFIECAHGTIPVPVPATSEIFAASHVVSKQIDIDTELVTPTGAAIIAELASSFQMMPTMNVEKIGWGAGTKDLTIPNVLKVSLGSIEDSSDDIMVMETNIDDCHAEILAYTMEQLFIGGALDVFFTPIYMKKNRPGQQLTVLCTKGDFKTLQDIIFKHTTTIGIRYHCEQRTILPRSETTIDTPYGKIAVKEVTHNGNTYVYPEYESIKEIADTQDISIQELYAVVTEIEMHKKARE